MNDNYTQYQEDSKIDALDNSQGVAETYETFKLDLPDNDITDVLDRRINDSRTFWNDKSSFNLQGRRERNNRFVLGDHWYEAGLLSGGIPYVQNEIYIAEQVISAYVTARIAEIEVYPSKDTPESRRLAQNITSVIRNHCEEHDLQGILTNVVLSMLNEYVGFIELEWDANYGKNGDIVPSFIDPKNVIVDKRAKKGENPAFISFTRQDTAESLIDKFPKASDKIRNKVQDKLQSVITWRKVWITTFINQKPTEGIAHYFEDIVLAKSKTPHWIYDEETEGVTNYLSQPLKPVIPFNYINDGNHWIDRYGPIDQAIPLQLMIDRIGRQIQKGIAHSSPVLVFNKRALPKPAADQVKGEPWEKILVNSEDVTKAYGIIQANQIPSFVVNEIERLGYSLHELFGTPPQLRGASGQQTATQDLMARNEAQNRLDLLVRAIDRGLDKYFAYLMQMIKVHYTEDHYISAMGDDGRYDFACIKRDDIEDGIKIRVKSGSTLPPDKSRLEQVAIELAKLGKISILSMYEFLGVPNPGKHAERLIKEQVDPTMTVEDIRNDEQDANAVEDYESIESGLEIQPRDDVDSRHIKTHRQQLMSNDFKMWPTENQIILKAHIEQELEKLKVMNNITEEELYPPTPEEPNVSVNASMNLPAAASAATQPLPPTPTM